MAISEQAHFLPLSASPICEHLLESIDTANRRNNTMISGYMPEPVQVRGRSCGSRPFGRTASDLSCQWDLPILGGSTVDSGI